MKFSIIIAVLICLLPSNLICQETPDVDLPLLVSDNFGNSKELRYGLDPLGTDGIDLLLGEFVLPPNPPAGIFDVRFRVANLESSWKDYRNGTFNFVGEKIDTIYYQIQSGTSILTFEWNMPNGVTGLLQDMFGGAVVNKPMSGIDSYNLTNFFVNPLKIIIYYDGTVPVELSSFDATVVKCNIILNWTTQTEINNYGFDIERAVSSKNSSGDISLYPDFKKLYFISGNGNSNSPKKYSYTDKNILGGSKFYYRLKIIDNDGKFEYSDVVEVKIIPTEFALYQNYPNPFNPITIIRYQLPKESKFVIKIYNILGAEVLELMNDKKEAGIYEVEFNADILSSGTYIYRISTGSFVETKKMLLLK